MTMTYVRTELHALLTFQKDVIPQDIHKVHGPQVTNVYVVVESNPANTRQTVQFWLLVTQRLSPSLTAALDLLVLQ